MAEQLIILESLVRFCSRRDGRSSHVSRMSAAYSP